MLVSLLFMAPIAVWAASVIDPVEEAACVVVVEPTSGDRFRIEEVQARLSSASVSDCERDLLEFDVLPGDTVSIDDVPGDADRYQIPFSVGATSNSASASLFLHYYGEDAIEQNTAARAESTTESKNGLTLTASEREALKVTIMTQMVVVMQRIIFLFGLL